MRKCVIVGGVEIGEYGRIADYIGDGDTLFTAIAD